MKVNSITFIGFSYKQGEEILECVVLALGDGTFEVTLQFFLSCLPNTKFTLSCKQLMRDDERSQEFTLTKFFSQQNIMLGERLSPVRILVMLF